MKILGVAALCGLSTIVGCSGDKAPAPMAAPTHAAVKAAPAKRGPTPDELTVGMVEAVVLGKSPLNSQIKFELSERPVIGEQLDVAIALIPKVAAAPATLSMSVTSDVDLVPGYDHLEIPKVEPGEVYRNRIKVVPRQEGVGLVTVELSLKHDDLVDSKVFSIPLLVTAK